MGATESAVEVSRYRMTGHEPRVRLTNNRKLKKTAMDRRRNLLIGIVAGVVIVGTLSYATGLTKVIRRSFGSSTEYKTSESAAAPELVAGEWINSTQLKLNDLRGRVVLLEFWTFGCYNCHNTLPYVKSWDDRYRDKGLTVIGVHSPEFDEERDVEHLRRAVSSL